MDQEKSKDIDLEKKILEFEALKGNVKCAFCVEFVKKGNCCYTEAESKKCYRIKQHIPVKTTCEFCSKYFDNPKALGGHIISCKYNPKRKERVAKISKTKMGHKPSTTTNLKNSLGVRKSKKNKILDQIEDLNYISIQGKDESKPPIKFNFYDE